MPESMTRAEHLQWAKDRALAYLNPPEVVEHIGERNGRSRVTADGTEHRSWPPEVTPKQLSDALASILSDLRKHPEIDPSAAEMVFGMEAFSGGLKTAESVRHFINGIN
jgi:hypothetical protein